MRVRGGGPRNVPPEAGEVEGLRRTILAVQGEFRIQAFLKPYDRWMS